MFSFGSRKFRGEPEAADRRRSSWPSHPHHRGSDPHISFLSIPWLIMVLCWHLLDIAEMTNGISLLLQIPLLYTVCLGLVFRNETLSLSPGFPQVGLPLSKDRRTWPSSSTGECKSVNSTPNHLWSPHYSPFLALGGATNLLKLLGSCYIWVRNS